MRIHFNEIPSMVTNMGNQRHSSMGIGERIIVQFLERKIPFYYLVKLLHRHSQQHDQYAASSADNFFGRNCCRHAIDLYHGES